MTPESGAGTPDVRLGTFLGIVSAFGFASGPIFAVLLYQRGFNWLPLLAWRFIIASCLAWAIVGLVPVYRSELRTLSRRRVSLLLTLGLLFVGAAATYYLALIYIPVSVAVLVVNLSPAIIALFSIWLGFRLQGWRAWGALAIATVGAVLAVIGPTARIDLRGIGLVVLSAIVYALWATFAARSAGERKGSRVMGTSSGPAVAIMFSAAAVILTTIVLIVHGSMSLDGLRVDGMVYLLGFAIIGSTLGLQASYASAARLGASRAGIFMTAEPVFTIVLAALFLGEGLTAVQLVGGALVTLAILLIQSSPAQPAPLIGT